MGAKGREAGQKQINAFQHQRPVGQINGPRLNRVSHDAPDEDGPHESTEKDSDSQVGGRLVLEARKVAHAELFDPVIKFRGHTAALTLVFTQRRVR